MRTLVLSSIALVSLFVVPTEAALSKGNLLGRWCGEGVTYSISSGSLTVSRKGEKKSQTIKIKGIGVGENEIQVFYADPYGGGSKFAEFSPDGRSMAQQGSAFGSMPRRAFKRC